MFHHIRNSASTGQYCTPERTFNPDRKDHPWAGAQTGPESGMMLAVFQAGLTNWAILHFTSKMALSIV